MNAEREKLQANRLKFEATIDQLQRDLIKKSPSTGQEIIRKLEPVPDEGGHNSDYLLKAVINELRNKNKESENMQSRIDFEQKARNLESEYQEKLNALKTQMKHVFNLDLQNLKLTYEHQLKQLKITIKKKEEEAKLYKDEMVKRETEIALIKEKNRHYESERKLRLEHAEFLCRVFF